MNTSIDTNIDASSEPILIYSPFGDMENARSTGKLAVKRKLAACVNLVPGLTSIFEWDGKVEEAQEILLFAKTTSICVPDLIELILKEHAYDEPAIVCLPIVGGAPTYLDWIRQQTS